MAETFAFDVYGTLVNPHAVVGSLEKLVGDKAGRLSQTWRDKQLEYSFRRALMGAYRDFSIVTRDALNYACAALEVTIADPDKAALLAQYRTLDAFPDTAPALAALAAQGHKMHAFSNGLPDHLASLLAHAGIENLLGETISVHDVPSFKPDPTVYVHFNEVTGSAPGETWLVSSNP
ncbi:MAG: haloacid dehalogenase type II, partial [Pseudomonadota bacterium]